MINKEKGINFNPKDVEGTRTYKSRKDLSTQEFPEEMNDIIKGILTNEDAPELLDDLLTIEDDNPNKKDLDRVYKEKYRMELKKEALKRNEDEYFNKHGYYMDSKTKRKTKRMIDRKYNKLKIDYNSDLNG